jgi:hypothetical protein
MRLITRASYVFPCNEYKPFFHLILPKSFISCKKMNIPTKVEHTFSPPSQPTQWAYPFNQFNPFESAVYLTRSFLPGCNFPRRLGLRRFSVLTRTP